MKKTKFRSYRKPISGRRLYFNIKRFKKKIILFCCKKELFLNLKIPVFYNPRKRTYSLILNTGLFQLIFFCPWCGKKFPRKLEDDYSKILKKEYKIDDPYLDDEDIPNFPEEFKSDEWWKKRGL